MSGERQITLTACGGCKQGYGLRDMHRIEIGEATHLLRDTCHARMSSKDSQELREND